MPEPFNSDGAYLVLNAIPNIGPITTNRLLQKFDGDPLRIFTASAHELESVNGVGPVISKTVREWQSHFDLEKEQRKLAQTGVDFIPVTDERYPRILREIHDPPIGLYQKGTWRWGRPAVAIVGSRRTTLYGQAVAKKFGFELARAGYCIVSGLARGIDTAAHEGALEAGGATAAVLGNGIDIIYPPENLELFRRIAATGAIVSEFPFGRRADRQSFPMRNRVVSGLCHAVVVVESDAAGGSMITAKFAGEQGRTLFAVPGRIDQSTSRGCHQLIRDGAMLCSSVEDIFDELGSLTGLRAPAGGESTAGSRSVVNLTEDEDAVIARFTGGAMLTLDDLAVQTQMPLENLSPVLMMLELKRLLVRRIDGAYELRS
jgi:DNA processing protein